MGCKSSKRPPANPAGDPNYPPHSFQATVDKAAADRAGLNVEPSADKKYLTVVAFKDSSSMQDPTKADGEKICEGDDIVIVNGQYGDAEKMMAIINKAGKKNNLVLGVRKAGKPPASAATATTGGQTTENVESKTPAEPGAAADNQGQVVAQDVPLKNDGTPRFDGVWNPKALINGRKLVWLVDNSEAELTFIGDNKCTVVFEGKEYTGTMIDDNKLEWDDGDTWERDATGQSAGQGVKRSSEKKEAMCPPLC